MKIQMTMSFPALLQKDINIIYIIYIIYYYSLCIPPSLFFLFHLPVKDRERIANNNSLEEGIIRLVNTSLILTYQPITRRCRILKDWTNQYILIYEKNDREYNRIMECEIRFAAEEDLLSFIENLKLDRNVRRYCVICKECFKRDRDWNWPNIDDSKT